MNVLHDNHHHHHSSVYSDLNFSTKKFDMSTNVMDTDIHDISTNVNTDNITDNSNSNPFYKLLTHFPSYVFMNNHHHGADSMNTIHEPILTSGNFIGNGTSAFRTPSPIMDFLKEQSNITQSSPKQPLSNHMYPKNLCHQNTILTDDMTGQFSSTKMHITDLQSTIQLANKLAQHFISLSNNHNCSDPVKCDPAVLRTEQPTYQRDYHILQQPQPQQEQEQMTLLNSTYLNLASKMNNFCETNIHSLEQLTELLYQQYYHPNINTTGNSNSSSSNKPSFLLDSHNQMDSSHFDETVQFTPLQSSLEESGCIDLSYSGANKTPTGQNKLSLVNPSSATLLNDIVACSTISSSNNTESNTDHHIGESSETCESLIQKTLNKLHQNSNISSFLTSTLKTASMMNASSIPSSSSYNISNEPTSKVQQTTVNYSPLQTFPLSFTLPVNTNDYHGTNDFFSNLLKLKIPTPDKLKEIFVNTNDTNNKNINTPCHITNNVYVCSVNGVYSPQLVNDNYMKNNYTANNTTSSSSNSSIITTCTNNLDKHSHQTTNVSTRTKNRKSGFQAGVTVGYTYDAFFISDGRSRKRVKNSLAKQIKSHSRRSYPIDDSSNLISPRSNRSTSGSCSLDGTCMSNCPNDEPSDGILNGQSKSHVSITSSSLLASSTESQKERYSCPDCGKNYATSSNLSRHKQTHRSLDSQSAKKCPQCGKAYVSMPALSMHLLTHDLKHQCDICGKAFSRPWLLQGHRRAHTGEKPYGCAHCGRAFADRSNLRAHMQTHSGMKQFECKKCHKNFALKSYLNKHLESGCMNRSDWSMNSSPATDESKSHQTSEKTPKIEFYQQSDLPWSVTKLIN